MNVGVYGRLSVAKQADDLTELAIERQHERAVAYCHAKGWTPACFYQDVDSAYRRPGQKKAPPRPGFEQCLADVEAGLIGGIVFFKLDRFVRDRADFERALAVGEAHGAILASVREPLDTSSPMGEAVASLLVTFADWSPSRSACGWGSNASRQPRVVTRTLAAHARSAGSRTRRTPDPREAAIIREVAARLLTGEPLGAISADVNRRYGMKWPPANWRRILRAPRVAGIREHRGEVVATDAWPAILDPETWHQVNTVLPAKERSGRPPKHLLVGGISRCGVCGLQLYSRPERGGITRYVCAQPPEHQGCGRISIRSRPLDAYVVEAVITALSGPRLTELLAGADADQDQAVAAGLERDKATLLELSADYYQRRMIDRETFFANRRPLQDAIEAAERRLARRASRGVLE